MADGSVSTFQYDAMGRTLLHRQSRGVVTTYGYDALSGRLLTIGYSDGTPGITYSYNDRGQTVSVTDASGTRTFEYNDRMDLVRENLEGDSSISFDRTDRGVASGYDLTVDGDWLQKVRCHYDPHSSKIDHLMFNGKAFSFEYLQGTDLLKKIISPDGMVKETEFEPYRDLPVSQTYRKNGSLMASFGMAFDSMRRLTESQDRIMEPHSAQLRSVNRAYSYNDRGEVVSDLLSGGDARYYHYDPAGNRSSCRKNQEQTIYMPNSLNQYISQVNPDNTVFGSEYDPDGNQIKMQTSTGEWQITWNADNRPVLFTKGNEQVECIYDYQGRRVRKIHKINGTTQRSSRFFYFGYQLVAEKVDTDPELLTWLWNPVESHGTPLFMQKVMSVSSPETDYPSDYPTEYPDSSSSGDEGSSSDTSGSSSSGTESSSSSGNSEYPVATGWNEAGPNVTTTEFAYICDFNGNVRTLSDARPESADLAQVYDYDAFGNRTSRNSEDWGNPFGFSSEFFDKDLGLVYYNFRHYNPKDGRWISRDPIAESGGVNLYGFIGNNPITNKDLLGLEDNKWVYRDDSYVYNIVILRSMYKLKATDMLRQICENDSCLKKCLSTYCTKEICKSEAENIAEIYVDAVIKTDLSSDGGRMFETWDFKDKQAERLCYEWAFGR